MRLSFIFAGFLGGLLSTSAIAATCNQASRSDDIVLMRCSVDSTSETWIAAAKQACGEDKSCNVWFWHHGVELPKAAPLKDIDLPKNLTSKALAVWANDSSSLLTLKNAKTH